MRFIEVRYYLFQNHIVQIHSNVSSHNELKSLNKWAVALDFLLVRDKKYLMYRNLNKSPKHWGQPLI